MSKKEQGTVTFTDSQFRQLRELLESYVKVSALGAIREVAEKEIVKNAWLLNAAGYSQYEIASILQTSQPTVSRILAGKPSKDKAGEEEK